MKKYFPLLILISAGLVIPQTAGKATVTYSMNDKLVSLANLTDGLSDCPIRSAAGKVKGYDVDKKMVEVSLKVDKKTTAKVLIPLDRVADEDRKAVFKHLITKNNVLRASGYGCEEDKPFLAFSVDRVY